MNQLYVEFQLLGSEWIYADCEIEVSIDEGTQGSLIGKVIEFKKLVVFDFATESEDGNLLEETSGCTEESNPNIFKEIESYITLNWNNLINLVRTCK